MATIKDKYVLDIDTKGATSSIMSIKGAMGALAGALAIRELVQFGASIVSATTQFERYQTVLTTFLGSQSKANAELARLKDLANSLPQDLADVTEAFVIFTRYGLDTSSEAIKAFSNIATASGKSLEQLGEALGDAMTGQYERLKEFGIKVSTENNKVVARIGEDIVATGRTATELTRNLKELGNTRFGGAAEANAGTLSQSMSNLKGAVFEAQVAFGEGLKPALIEITTSMAELLRQNEALAESLGAGVGEALRVIAGGAKFLAENIHLLTTALTSFIVIKSVPFLIDIAKKFFALGAAVSDLGGPMFRAKDAAKNLIGSLLKFGIVGRIFAAFTGPVGLAVAGITALAAGFKALGPVTVEVSGLTTTYGEIASAVFFRVKKAVVALATDIREGLGKALSFVTQKVMNFARPLVTALNLMLEKMYSFVNTAIGLFKGFILQVTTGIGDIPRMFLAVMNASLGIIGDFVGRAGSQIGELWDYIFSGGDDAIENSFTGIGDTIDKQLAKIGSESSVNWSELIGADHIGNAVDAITTPLRVLIEEYREEQEALANVGKEYDDHILRLARAAELAEKIAKAQAKINEAIAEENELRAKSLATFQGTLDKFNEEYKFRTSLIKLTDDQREKEEQRFALQQKLATAILPVQTRILELEQLNTDASKARIKVLKDSIGDIQEVYETELGYLDKMVDARNTELRLKRESDSIDQARLSASEAILEVQERINRASEDASLGGLSGINRELKEIELNELRIARAAKTRITAQLEKGVDANIIAGELAKIDAITKQAIMKQQDLAKTAYENSRMFSTGWKKAFEEYEDNATNASKSAQRIFEKSTKGMEDAIVGFAKTGKFEWKGFVNSILEELLRSQVQQLIAKTFGGLGLGGGSGGGGGLFGGFFATGGMIPPGRFGVVGENGPELVSGPANVTPNLGGGNVTYNINAVDAMSFKQMVAQDPSFLFAVTEQGRRTLPQTRR
jgi:hypothetical protein